MAYALRARAVFVVSEDVKRPCSNNNAISESAKHIKIIDAGSDIIKP